MKSQLALIFLTVSLIIFLISFALVRHAEGKAREELTDLREEAFFSQLEFYIASVSLLGEGSRTSVGSPFSFNFSDGFVYGTNMEKNTHFYKVYGLCKGTCNITKERLRVVVDS